MDREYQQNCFRPDTTRLVLRLLAPLLDSGTVTAYEYDQIAAVMKALSHAKAPPTPLKLITGQEAAEQLGISFSQFRALEKEGAFPFSRKMVGSKTVRYRNTDIIRYMLSTDEIGKAACGNSDASDASDANSKEMVKR